MDTLAKDSTTSFEARERGESESCATIGCEDGVSGRLLRPTFDKTHGERTPGGTAMVSVLRWRGATTAAEHVCNIECLVGFQGIRYASRSHTCPAPLAHDLCPRRARRTRRKPQVLKQMPFLVGSVSV